VKDSVRALNDTGIAHELAPDLRLEEGPIMLQGRPGKAILTVGQMEAVFAIAPERGEQIDTFMMIRICGLCVAPQKEAGDAELFDYSHAYPFLANDSNHVTE